MDDSETLVRPKKTLAKKYGAFKRLPGEGGGDTPRAPKLVFASHPLSPPGEEAGMLPLLPQEPVTIEEPVAEQYFEEPTPPPIEESREVAGLGYPSETWSDEEEESLVFEQEEEPASYAMEPEPLPTATAATLPKVNRAPREHGPRLYHSRNPIEEGGEDASSLSLTPDESEESPAQGRRRDVRVGLLLIILVVALNVVGMYVLDWVSGSEGEKQPAAAEKTVSAPVASSPVAPISSGREMIQRIPPAAPEARPVPPPPAAGATRNAVPFSELPARLPETPAPPPPAVKVAPVVRASPPAPVARPVEKKAAPVAPAVQVAPARPVAQPPRKVEGGVSEKDILGILSAH